MSNDAEFDRLVNQYLESTLGEDDLQSLERQLLHDQGSADRFAAWCLMHRQILDLETEGRLHELMDQFVTALPGPSRTAVAERAAALRDDRQRATLLGTRQPARAERNTKQRLGTWAIATLAVAGLIAVVMLDPFGWRGGEATVGPRDGVAGGGRPAADSASRETIASLTRLVDPVWAPDARVLHVGQYLRRGSRVQLGSGLAKVTFHCGAEVALQGPCDFQVRDEMVGILREGKMTADVPRRAFAFAILCPGVELVDLGTSFGVAVGSAGQTELHVFEGEVLCNRSVSDHQRPTAGIHVKARQAMQFSSQHDDPNDIAINVEQFSGLISLRRGVTKEPGRLTPNDLALWLSADVAVISDEQSLVPCWPDIIYGDNVSAEDAIQANEHARPRLVANAINGHPAVRFDGKSDFLLTTPLETTDDQTVLLVCQFSQSVFDSDRIWGGQILNYDGPPNRYLSTTLEPGVLQIGEPLLADEFKPSLITGQVFAGFIGSATVEAGRVDAHQVGADVPVVVAYRYDFGNEVAELRINGRSYGTARAFAPQEITSRKIIGRHAWKQLFFHGDLAELLIYNKALTSEELAATTTYLAEKYAIEVESPTTAPTEVNQ